MLRSLEAIRTFSVSLFSPSLVLFSPPFYERSPDPLSLDDLEHVDPSPMEASAGLLSWRSYAI